MLVALWDLGGSPDGKSSGKVSCLARAFTDVSIDKIKVAHFDDTRMVSCGYGNVRFWRVKDSRLKSCSVNLEDNHNTQFIDVAFDPFCCRDDDQIDRNVYAATKSGLVMEICYKAINLKRVWRLFPQSGGVSVSSLALHEGFCITGSEDGFLRVWSRDFDTVIMEAEYSGAVTSVSVTQDGLQILAGTSHGTIGILDAASKKSQVLMRSHSQSIVCMSLSPRGGHLATGSRDGSVRIWELDTGSQLFEFEVEGDVPCCVIYHPSRTEVVCGFVSGAVRVLDIPTATITAEHYHHHGLVTGLALTASGKMFSCSASGSLAVYDSTLLTYPLLKLLGNTVSKGRPELGPSALALSPNGRFLAFVGPSDFSITVLHTETLDEILHIDITPNTTFSSASASALRNAQPRNIGEQLGAKGRGQQRDREGACADSARLLAFAPSSVGHLVVVTKQGRLLKFSATSGQLLSEVAPLHESGCSALAVSGAGDLLFTASQCMIKVWDYSMSLDTNYQKFIGHSETVSQLVVSPDSRRLVSCGEALFIWEIVSGRSSPPLLSRGALLPKSASPRRKAPVPTSYEPVDVHSFTPVASNRRPPGASMTDASSPCSSDNREDSSSVEENHDGGEGNPSERVVGLEVEAQDSLPRASDADEESSVTGDEIVIDHTPRGAVELVVKSHSSLREPSPIGVLEPASPAARRHYRYVPPASAKPSELYIAPPNHAGMRLTRVVGCSGRGRRNVVWAAKAGMVMYSSGCLIVMENLATGNQSFLYGHPTEISTIASQHSGAGLASASHRDRHWASEIRIWDTEGRKCVKVIEFHLHGVACLAYSRDDRFLISVGTFSENVMVVWSSRSYAAVATASLAYAMHDIAWDPRMAYEFASVGVRGVTFWMLEERLGGQQAEIKVHEPQLPVELLSSDGEPVECTCLCYIATTSQLYVGCANGIICIWDTKNNRCKMFWKTGCPEIGALLCNTSRLILGGANGLLQLWQADLSSEQSLVTLEHSQELDGGIFTLSFDPQLELGVVGTSAGSIWQVSWSDWMCVKMISGHSENVAKVCFSPDGQLLASAGFDGQLAVWSLASHEKEIAFETKKACTAVAFSSLPDKLGSCHRGSLCAVGGYEDGVVRLFELELSKVVLKLHPHKCSVTALAIADNGSVILSGGVDGTLVVSNALTGTVIKSIADHKGAPITDMDARPGPTKLPDLGPGSELWLAASHDRRVSVWSADWPERHCQLADWLTFPGPDTAPDGTHLTETRGKQQWRLLPPSLARFSPNDPDMLLYSGYGLDMSLQFYSLTQKTVVKRYRLTHWPTSMCISCDSHLIGLGSRDQVLQLMDYEEGSFQEFASHCDTVSAVAFSPTIPPLLVSASQNYLHLWDILVGGENSRKENQR